jgi:hypothetical protein
MNKMQYNYDDLLYEAIMKADKSCVVAEKIEQARIFAYQDYISASQIEKEHKKQVEYYKNILDNMQAEKNYSIILVNEQYRHYIKLEKKAKYNTKKKFDIYFSILTKALNSIHEATIDKIRINAIKSGFYDYNIFENYIVK